MTLLIIILLVILLLAYGGNRVHPVYTGSVDPLWLILMVVVVIVLLKLLGVI